MTNKGTTPFQEQMVILGTKYLAAKRFQNDAPFWQASDGFVEGEVSSFASENCSVFLWIVLCEPNCMDGDWIQEFTSSR